jgi:hypothetical protein
MARATSRREIQLTDQPVGHILTNTSVWSPDGKWIVYDTRSDPAGDTFDGQTIELVHSETREIREVYRATNGAHCGVATFSPRDGRVVFILGPKHATDDWRYCAWHRQGVIVDIEAPGEPTPLDACDLTPPYTAGALRGGSHVHVFNDAADRISFTYEDHVLSTLDTEPNAPPHELNQRNIGVSLLGHAVRVPSTHPRNHHGSAFSALVTRTCDNPCPGSDDITRAFDEAWIGTHGYLRPDGTRQQHALAFQGRVLTDAGQSISEIFIVDIPDDITKCGEAPITGTSTTRPAPPRGTSQRRLTYTTNQKHPGLQGPRHWLRSSPDGSNIAFLMRDDTGIIQLWTISPNGGDPHQLTRNPFDVASAFSWNRDGTQIAFVADGSIFVSSANSGESTRLTEKTSVHSAPRPEACVFSPDGSRIAYVRSVPHDNATFNQIFIVEVS